MGKLIADALAGDPRVSQGKKLILDALSDHQRQLDAIQPADPTLKTSYEQTVTQFGQMRGGALIYPYLASGFGRGALVELADGSVKYDFITGIGVHAWGHCHRLMVEAALDAALSDTIMQGNLQQDRSSVTLVQTLLDAAQAGGAKLAHCLLTTSGAMANENALKIMLQKRSPADRILALEGCFMGRTLALAQITDKPAYRQGLPTTIAVDYVPFFDPQRPDESTHEAVAVLRHHLGRYPGQHAAMCFELVQGEGGYNVGHREYFIALMDQLKAHSVPIMIDEVQTFGRTHRLFAFEHFGLDAYVDVVTIGKLSQVCATLFTDDIKPKPGLVSQTFTGSTAAIAASQRIVNHLIHDGYFGTDGKIADLHNHFVSHLRAIAKRQPGAIGGPFGLGAMIAFTPLDGTAEKARRLAIALYDAGVIAFVAGSQPTRLRFLMPIGAVTHDDIDVVCGVIEKILAEVSDT